MPDQEMHLYGGELTPMRVAKYPSQGLRVCERCAQEIDPRTRRARSVMTEVGQPCKRCGNDAPVGSYAWEHDVLIRFNESTEHEPTHFLFTDATAGRTFVPQTDTAIVLWGSSHHIPFKSYGQKAHHLTLLGTPNTKKKGPRAA